MKTEAATQQNKDDPVKELAKFDRDAIQDLALKRFKTLTTPAEREFLQSIMIARDQRNSGMTRKEVIAIIANIGGVDLKAAENHLDYLIRSKQLSNLKNNGRVITAQATTTNRTAVTAEKLLRTHCSQTDGKISFRCTCLPFCNNNLTFLSAWELQNHYNGWDVTQMTPLQIVEHYNLVDHFTLNLDESCMMANTSKLKIIGSRSKRKHEKNTSDCHESITAVRVGSSDLQQMWMVLASISQKARRLSSLRSRNILNTISLLKDLE